MAGWFDNAAKRSAQRAGTDIHVGRHAQISRRRLIVGGSAAAATAWTAPMLMASSAAAVGASACPAGTFICGTDPATAVCCPNGQTCNPTGGLGGTPSCHERDRRDLRKLGHWTVPSGALQRQRKCPGPVQRL